MDSFRGKRAFVTGGGTGIGRGIVLKLAELGAEVYAVGRREEHLSSLRKENPKINTIQLDVTDWNQTRETVEKLTPIHLLVNNAAIALLNSVLEATPEEFDTSFNLNVKAVINITQTMAKGLISKKESGCVVNLSSQASHLALRNHLIYCSSKASLDMLTKSFALELGPHNIRVNAVNPTVVMTDMGKIGWSDPAKAAVMLSRIPQGRFAEVEEVVNAVIYLLSDRSEMINGHALPVDGGFLAC
ncbi:UNVERIFIED_CONTAM: hypothetical protein GTU68_060151 [Idotea baltica]|nr:hypothetical protein [Idotea baltica]